MKVNTNTELDKIILKLEDLPIGCYFKFKDRQYNTSDVFYKFSTNSFKKASKYKGIRITNSHSIRVAYYAEAYVEKLE